MPRQIQIFLPADNDFKEQRERVRNFLRYHPHVHSFSAFTGEDHFLFIFRTPDSKVKSVIGALSDLGVGRDYGVIDIIQLQATKPLLTKKGKHKREYRTGDRMTVEEIYNIVDSQLHLTFDYLVYTVLASIIAAVGLATDSAVTVVASMIVDPFMGPILGITFGTCIHDKTMFKKSLRNELIGVSFAFLIGCMIGIIPAVVPLSKEGSLVEWGNQEMMSRGILPSLWTGILIAIPCGAGAALSVTQGGSLTIIGIAISAALLPPVVNSGMNVTYGLLALFVDDIPAKNGWIWLSVAMYSFLLFVVNLVFIYITGIVFFKIKKIGPMDSQKKKKLQDYDAVTYGKVRASTIRPINDEQDDDETLNLIVNNEELRSPVT
jgi:uncharacterized hydrophobic protein (TIGR00341 family)